MASTDARKREPGRARRSDHVIQLRFHVGIPQLGKMYDV